MSRRLTLAVSVAAACAVGAGILAGVRKQPAGRIGALARRSSMLPRVRQWASSGAVAAEALPGSAGSALRQAATWVRRDAGSK